MRVRMLVIVVTMLRVIMRMTRMFCEFPVLKHADPGRRDAAAVDGADVQRCAEIKRRYSSMKHIYGNASTDQSTEEHIAADTGKAIKISNTHGSYCFTFAEVIADAGSTSFIEPER